MHSDTRNVDKVKSPDYISDVINWVYRNKYGFGAASATVGLTVAAWAAIRVKLQRQLREAQTKEERLEILEKLNRLNKLALLGGLGATALTAGATLAATNLYYNKHPETLSKTPTSDDEIIQTAIEVFDKGKKLDKIINRLKSGGLSIHSGLLKHEPAFSGLSEKTIQRLKTIIADPVSEQNLRKAFDREQRIYPVLRTTLNQTYEEHLKDRNFGTFKIEYNSKVPKKHDK